MTALKTTTFYQGECSPVGLLIITSTNDYNKEQYGYSLLIVISKMQRNLYKSEILDFQLLITLQRFHSKIVV